MTTRGIIVEIPDGDDNVYKVRVPLLENGGTDTALIDAVACNSPGVYNAYQVNDIVIITFEDEKMNTAVINGEMYIEQAESNSVYNLLNELKVTGKATLPADTKIGDYSAQDLFNLYNGVKSSSGGSQNYKLVKVWGDKNG